MIASERVYLIRRVVGLLLYIIAYSALWPGLTQPTVKFQSNPRFWSGQRLGLQNDGTPIETTTRTTLQIISELFLSGFYFSSLMIFLFSVVAPCVKLVIIVYSEIQEYSLSMDENGTRCFVHVRKRLRSLAKYQCVDVFVTIISRQLLNSDILLCELEPGFYFFTCFALVSIIASQVRDASRGSFDSRFLTSRSRNTSPPSDRITKLDALLLFTSTAMFAIGILWALLFPILAVKFLFESKIVVGQQVSTLNTFFVGLRADAPITDIFCSALVGSTCLYIPSAVVFLSIVVLCGGFCRRTPIYHKLSRLITFMNDWALLDVFATALLTSLFAFASFPVLRTHAPWGFYCILMAAMSAHEVSKNVGQSIVEGPAEYSRLTYENEVVEGFELDNMQDEKLSNQDYHVSPRTSRSDLFKSTRVTGGFAYVVTSVVRRLGLPFFMLKALGWAVFFIIWFMNTSHGSLDIRTLNSTVRGNVRVVTKGLHDALPDAVGMCVDYHNDHQGAPCIDKGNLFYDRNVAYEVLARWMSGFREVEIVDMYVSVPVERKLLLTVRGVFKKIHLSLFIGQCLGNLFGDESGKGIPYCSKVFDEVHSWKDVTWGIQVEADCDRNSPYVRNIIINQVTLESEMKIEQSIGWGFSLPIEDLSEEFKQGIRQSIQPLLVNREPWIPWGPRNYDLTSLLSMLVELNADSLDGTIQFKCPSPAS
jgi:uncharacterized paraquat-inducible protein A